MQYPLISEYVEAIRMAEDNLDELTNLSSVLDDDGNPVMSSGNFAVVFKMKDRESGKLFALKCFMREQPAREENYLRITEELSYVSSPYILNVRYLPKELFVDTDQSNEDEFPVLVMDWVEGQTLDAYLRDNIDNPSRLKKLSSDFNRMALWLLTQPFAHGDLKPDNIIVKSDGSLVLVDYDGMYVPAMKDRQSRETGSPNFRHPQRSEKWFDEYIDDFPLSLMATSLYALGLKPELLKEYNAKDAILFTEKDLLNLPQSKLYSALSAFLYDKTFAKLHSLMQLSLARVPIKGMYAPVIADLDARQDVYKSLFDKAMKLYKTSDDKTEAYRLLAQVATPDYLTQPMQIYCKTSEETEAEKRGIKLYTSSAENNDVTAQFILGECYYYGWGVEQDYKQAVAWYRKAANQSYARAQCNLGVCYYNGEGVDQDYKQAVAWYRKAAEQGNARAQCNLGYCYDIGQGVEQDYKQAVAWYRKAAEQGEATAQCNLGYCYEAGQGIEQDYKQAVAWYEQAAKQGNEKAKENLNDLLNPEITDEEYEEAITDEYGAKYTKGGLKLISVPEGLKSYTIKEGTRVIGYYCDIGSFADTSLQSVVIPNSVTYIGDYAFSDCTSLQSVVIPDSVTEIGSSAFYGCTSLQSVVIPDGVTEIGESAFEDCSSLHSVVIPNGVTEIGNSAFRYCTSLQSVVIPDSVTYIGDDAFYGCESLQSVVIPDSVTEIGNGAFNGCRQLTLNCKSPFFKVENNILYSKNGRVISCWSENKVIELPYGITEIGKRAFGGCTSLQSIAIPDSVTKIGSGAFSFCSSLQSVVIPDGVTEIGESVFSGCESLQSVVIPDSVTEIGKRAFNGCKSLQSVVIPDSVTYIGREAFSGCTSLQSVVLPDGVTKIGDYAFSGCTSLQFIVIPDSVTEIGDYAFSDCTSLQSVVIPDGVTKIGWNAFSGCTSLQSVVIPNSVTYIGDYAFRYCTSLQSVIIPDSLIEIGRNTFQYCSSLQPVVIPEHIRYIIHPGTGNIEDFE